MATKFFLLALSLAVVGRSYQDQVCTIRRADIVIIMDESTSISDDNYKKEKQFIVDLVSSMEIGESQTRIGMITYATRPEKEFYMNEFTDKASLTERIMSMSQQKGDTHTWEALEMARRNFLKPENGGRPGAVPQFVIVVTDGRSQQPLDTKKQAAILRKTTNATTIAVGIKMDSQAGRDELLAIAGSPERVVTVKNFDELAKSLEKIRGKACRYTKPPRDPGCKVADLAFVSNTQYAGHYDLVELVDHMKSISKELKIGSDDVKVASIPIPCSQIPEFGLDDHTTKDDLLAALEVEEMSSLVEQLSKAREVVLSPSGGGRNESHRAVVLFTDGDQFDVAALKEEAAKLKAEEIDVFIVGIGQVDKPALESIATNPADIIYVNSYEDLARSKASLVNKICNK